MNHELSVAASLRGRHIVVVGATGFLGKVWLAMLLDRVPDVRRVTVIARGHGKAPAHRIERMMATSPAFRAFRTRSAGAAQDIAARVVEVRAGDLSEPLVGLSASTIAELRDTVDLIVNIAGLTEFDPDPRDAIAVNVRGALHVADLAARLGAPLLHVSTCFVAGQVSKTVPETLADGKSPNGSSLDLAHELEELERACLAIDAAAGKNPKKAKRDRTAFGMERARSLGFQNTYTYSKALAEEAVSRTPALSYSIVRPSIIECAMAYPFPGWNEGMNTSAPLVWLLSTPFRALPCREDLHFDVTPVDHAAQAMLLVAAALVRGEAERVVQVGTTDGNPLTIGRALELTNLGARVHFGRDSASTFERMVLRNLDSVAVRARARWAEPAWLRDKVRVVREGLERSNLRSMLPAALEKTLGDHVTKLQMKAHLAASTAEVILRRVDRMLTLFKPFIAECDNVYVGANVRALSERLPTNERELFAFAPESIDWRRYWIDVQYPGVMTWCLPLIRGERPPEDAEEMSFRVRTTEATARVDVRAEA